jgi:hypothetical protein
MVHRLIGLWRPHREDMDASCGLERLYTSVQNLGRLSGRLWLRSESPPHSFWIQYNQTVVGVAYRHEPGSFF